MRKVFICGCGHTGSTLLATMLSVHSEIYCPFVETWSYIYDDHKFLLRELLKEAKLRKESIFLEKTPKHIYHVDEIRKDHNPDFIFTVRNGYDCVASLEKRYNDFDKAYNRYINDHREVMKHSGHIVRYEDLISNPADTLEKICKHINISYESQMLNYHEMNLNTWVDTADNANFLMRAQQVKKPLYKPMHNINKEKCQTLEFTQIMEYFNYEH
tara:strand:- start:1330 stop:1971 length:642 start_codon:yes stop_codon:yes gene_type:complete